MKIDPVAGLLNTITLYRNDPARRFSEDEAALLEAVFPHLRVADRVSKMQRFKREAGATAETVGGFASCSAVGDLRYVEETFKNLLLRTWPQWRGPTLPAELRSLLARPTQQVATPGGLVASSHRQPAGSGVGEADGWFLHLRQANALDVLPARLREVAQALVAGKNHKQIAKDLGLAPATVRNHMAALNLRMGVSSRAELAAKLRQVASSS